MAILSNYSMNKVAESSLCSIHLHDENHGKFYHNLFLPKNKKQKKN